MRVKSAIYSKCLANYMFFNVIQRDSAVGRILFSSVFKAIFGEIEKEKTEREARETIEKIVQGLNKMLRDSTSFYPAFIACILDIVQGYPKMISLDAAEVFNACKTSMQPPLGKGNVFYFMWAK